MRGLNLYRMTACLAGLLTMLCLFFCNVGHCDMLREKSYMVRNDRGTDVLCDPYIVRKDDWVYKIFRQKGELSHQDFPEFLGIFKRLNPLVHDINTIRPGQVILIPLKKLDYDSLPGQAEGIVTIPFVTVSKVSEILHQYSSGHKIKSGDTLYGIMSRQFAPFGSELFNRGMKLFRRLNPNVTNLNRIYVGQIIRMPDDAIIRQPWFTAMFDESGNLKTEIALGNPADTSPSTHADVLSIKDLDPSRHHPEKYEKSVSDLAKAARIVNAKLRNRGTYYFPNPGGMDFRLDLSRFPVIELKNGRRIIFQDKTLLLKSDLDKIRSFWPDTEVTSEAPHTSLRKILNLFFAKQERSYEDNHLTFSDQGIGITLHANWITRVNASNKNEPDRLCITLIENPDEHTSPAIVRYLADHNILIKEIVYRGKTDIPSIVPESQNKPPVRQKSVVIETSNLRTFVNRLLTSLGFSYAPDTPITFPYAGIQVEARSNLVSGPGGSSLLIDFGDLYGDAISAIKQSGLNIVQLKQNETPGMVLQKILTTMVIPFKIKPVFRAARRPGVFNTVITIPGYLVKKGQSEILLSMLDLNKNIVRFLQERGILVIRYRPFT